MYADDVVIRAASLKMRAELWRRTRHRSGALHKSERSLGKILQSFDAAQRTDL
jgi:hypothetical protein